MRETVDTKEIRITEYELHRRSIGTPCECLCHCNPYGGTPCYPVKNGLLQCCNDAIESKKSEEGGN